MNLSERTSIFAKSKRRVGRGGKRGTTSGRGQKGQKSRAGRKIRPAHRDLIIRIPKRRGFANKTKSAPSLVIALFKLHRFTGNVTPEILRTKKLVPARFRGIIKVLDKGEIKNSINLLGIKVSSGARKKIEKAGGSVQEVSVSKKSLSAQA